MPSIYAHKRISTSNYLQKVRVILHYLIISSICFSVFPTSISAQASGLFTRIEDSSGLITSTGTWAQATLTDASGGTGKQSNTTNSTLSFTFTGTWISIGFRTSTNTGIAEILIDNVSQEFVDTYSRLNSTKTRIYDNLTSGSHTITVRVNGTRNPFSSANWIVVDYFDT